MARGENWCMPSPGREHADIEHASEQLQIGQPHCHWASILLEEQDRWAAPDVTSSPAPGVHEPSMQLRGILCLQPDLLQQHARMHVRRLHSHL